MKNDKQAAKGFTEEEIAAMKETIEERTQARRKGRRVLEKIAKMRNRSRHGKRVHAIVMKTAPTCAKTLVRDARILKKR